MKTSKPVNAPEGPLFVDPETNWTGTTYVDQVPAFRQLPTTGVHSTASAGAVTHERRGAVRRDLQLGIEIYGYDGELSLIHAYGTTHNVSATGLFAFVDVDLPVGSRAVVAVRPSHPELEPSILRGKVVRCNEQANGYGLAIHFDLDVDQFASEAA